MGYSTASTEWPEQTLSEPIRKIIDELFATLDDSTDAGADRLAEDNFTPNGEFLAHHAAHGKEEIRQSRKTAWTVITKRRHEIMKVYTDGSKQQDFLLLGNVFVVLRDGKELRSPFAARLVFDDPESNSPRVQMYQGIADTAPIMQALQVEL